MKSTKKILSVLLVLCMIMSFAACAAKEAPATEAQTQAPAAEAPAEASDTETADHVPADDHYPVTITNYNYAGEEVTYTYEKAPERVIAVYQGCIETMIALGLEDHMLASFGLDNEVKDEWKEGFSKMNYNPDVFSPDKETVTMLEPDMIFSWGSIFADKKLGDVGLWNEKGIATYMNSNTAPGGSRTLENEYTDILNIGKIFNVEDKAQAMVDEMKNAIDSTIAQVQGQQAPRAIVVQMRSNGTIRNFFAETLPGDMVTSLGGELIKPEGGDISKEELVALNPDVIFVTYMAYNGESPEEVIATQLGLINDDPALASLSAVKNGRVLPIMLGDVYAAAPRTIDGIRNIAAGMYPGLDLSK